VRMSFKEVVSKGDIPSERGHCAVSTIGSNLFLFGGTKYGEGYNDLFVLDVDKLEWKKLSTTGTIPIPRWGSSMTSFGKFLILFGGETINGLQSELYVLDTGTMTWSIPNQSGAGPSPRKNHTSTLYGKNLFIYGGEGIKTENHALLILNLEKWEWSYPSQGGEGAPEPRKGHSAAIFKNRLLIFGGWGTRAFEYFDDMWILDLDSLQWFKAKKKGPVPAPRAGHASVVFKDKLFVWGGWGSGSHPWNEIHYMDVDDFTWLKKKPIGYIPFQRFYHAAVPIKEQVLLFFGGQIGEKAFTNHMVTLNTQSIY